MNKTKIAAIAFAMLLATGAGTSVFAQKEAAQMPHQKQAITAEGTLKLQNGKIALASGNTTYFVPGLMRYSSFIDGIKDGAKVKVQGYVKGENMLKPTSITVDGKTHELKGPKEGRGQKEGRGCEKGKGKGKGKKGGWKRG